MKPVCALLICMIAGAFVPLAGQEKTAANLVGKWQYVSGVKDGTKVDPDNLKKQMVEFTKDKVTLTNDAKFVMKYDLDTSKKPVGIKLEMVESPFGAGAKAAGVIEVKGDEMRICYNPGEGDAPKTFDAKEGSKFHLFVLKRAK